MGADTGSVGASGSRLRLAGTLSARRGDGEGKGTENSVVWARKKREVAEAGGRRALVECKALGECCRAREQGGLNRGAKGEKEQDVRDLCAQR